MAGSGNLFNVVWEHLSVDIKGLKFMFLTDILNRKCSIQNRHLPIRLHFSTNCNMHQHLVDTLTFIPNSFWKWLGVRNNNNIFIVRKAREIPLVASIRPFVSLFVCLCALSCLNRFMSMRRVTLYAWRGVVDIWAQFANHHDTQNTAQDLCLSVIRKHLRSRAARSGRGLLISQSKWCLD